MRKENDASREEIRREREEGEREGALENTTPTMEKGEQEGKIRDSIKRFLINK